MTNEYTAAILGGLAAALVFVLAVVGAADHANDRGHERKLAKVEACQQIEDDGLAFACLERAR